VPSDSLNNGNALIPEPDDGCLVSAAIYARQSRVRDVAYSSCQSQIDMCREFAASKDWSITQVYSDEGYSSETLDRPQMSQLIAAIEMGEVRHLVVYSLDRLTRRMLHFQQLLELFARQNVSLAVMNDPSFSDSATGRLMANIIAAANEFQLDLTKERMADMRAAYKRDGKRVAGRVPFGYQTDPATKHLDVNEEQARRVHDFFELAAGGSRPSDLAGLANLQSWPDQRGETGKWTARRILKLLNNRVYIGEILNGDSTLPGAHQAIVSVTVFNEVQNLLASRRTSETKPRKKTDPSSRVHSFLTGKLICGQCNRPMSTSISHRGPVRYIYYRCRSDSGGKPRCPGVNVGVYTSAECEVQATTASKRRDFIERLTSSPRLMDLWRCSPSSGCTFSIASMAREIALQTVFRERSASKFWRTRPPRPWADLI
jgi:DNA invertase Pin-like site-specific DNA recombinase